MFMPVSKRIRINPFKEMSGKNEAQSTEKIRIVFSDMRLAEDHLQKRMQIGKEPMKLAGERLLSLKKAVQDSTLLLEKQQKLMLDLEVEEKQVISKINLWNDMLPQKEKLLEEERKELKNKKDEYFNEREKYCNALAKFVDSDGMLIEENLAEIHVLPKIVAESVNKISWNSSISLKKAERDTLKKEIDIWMKKIEEKKEIVKEKGRNLFDEESKKAIETEELRYEKLLNERQSEIKQLTYKLKLKKLRKNQELVNEAMSLTQNISMEPTFQSRPPNMNWSSISKPPILKRTFKASKEIKRKKPTSRSFQMRNLFNGSRFINASRNINN